MMEDLRGAGKLQAFIWLNRILTLLPLSHMTKEVNSHRGIVPLMTDTKKDTKKNPRITITPEAYQALCIKAALEMLPPGTLASKLILSYSQEALQALQTPGRESPSEAVSQEPREEDSQALPQAPIKTEKKKRLFQNPQALEEIKRLWEGGQRNQAEIARQIGYNRGTVFDNIKRMIKEGTLSPLDQ